jgi:hypothetical protein
MAQFMRFILCLSFTGCLSSPQATKEQADARHSQSHLEMSFEDLGQVGHYLIKAFDKEENACAIPADKVFAAPQLYRSLVDEKYSEVQDAYLQKSLKAKLEFWNPACAQSCSCDVYIGFSEYLQSFNYFLSTTELKAVERLKALQESGKSRTSVCMKQSTWVCDSRVLKEVLKRID